MIKLGVDFKNSISILPPKITLPDGQEMNTTKDPWEVKDLWRDRHIEFRFNDMLALHEDVRHKLQYVVASFLETRSISHSYNLLMRFRAFYKSILEGSGENIKIIELQHIINWKANLDSATLWQLGVVRILLEKSVNLGFGFCSPEALEWLAAAALPGNPKGNDVRTRDPNRGPFTAAEVAILEAALNDAYAEGGVDITDYAAGHVLLAFGVRSRQLVALKEKDLVVLAAEKGEKRYLLNIPQAKQRGQQIRESFRARSCDRRLGGLLQHLIADNAARKRDPHVPKGEWPMFVAPGRGVNPPGFAYHFSAAELAQRIRFIVERRTGFKANSKRFRHTLAQNLADDGASVYEIAEALGHSDTQQVGKYIEARPEMVSRLNHLAEDFAPILQAFAGQLISNDGGSALNAPKSKYLHDRSLDVGGCRPLGHCGQSSFCDLAKPIGCYTCRSFHAWDDGPHEQVLAKLFKERQQQIDRGLSPKIYTIKDRTIGAVTRVVQLCRQKRAEVLELEQISSRVEHPAVKKVRSQKDLEPRCDSIRTENALNERFQ